MPDNNTTNDQDVSKQLLVQIPDSVKLDPEQSSGVIGGSCMHNQQVGLVSATQAHIQLDIREDKTLTCTTDGQTNSCADKISILLAVQQDRVQADASCTLASAYSHTEAHDKKTSPNSTSLPTLNNNSSCFLSHTNTKQQATVIQNETIDAIGSPVSADTQPTADKHSLETSTQPKLQNPEHSVNINNASQNHQLIQSNSVTRYTQATDNALLCSEFSKHDNIEPHDSKVAGLDAASNKPETASGKPQGTHVCRNKTFLDTSDEGINSKVECTDIGVTERGQRAQSCVSQTELNADHQPNGFSATQQVHSISQSQVVETGVKDRGSVVLDGAHVCTDHPPPPPLNPTTATPNAKAAPTPEPTSHPPLIMQSRLQDSNYNSSTAQAGPLSSLCTTQQLQSTDASPQALDLAGTAKPHTLQGGPHDGGVAGESGSNSVQAGQLTADGMGVGGQEGAHGSKGSGAPAVVRVGVSKKQVGAAQVVRSGKRAVRGGAVPKAVSVKLKGRVVKGRGGAVGGGRGGRGAGATWQSDDTLDTDTMTDSIDDFFDSSDDDVEQGGDVDEDVLVRRSQRAGACGSRAADLLLQSNLAQEKAMWIHQIKPCESQKCHVDLRSIGASELAKMSRATWACQPFRDAVNTWPVIPPHRVAEVTGVQGGIKKRKGSHVEGDRAAVTQAMREYLDGQRMEPPWQALGISRAPNIQTLDLDLRAVHRIVSDMGGYSCVTSKAAWTHVAHTYAAFNDVQQAALQLRNYYQKCVLRYVSQKPVGAGGVGEAGEGSLAMDGDSGPGAVLWSTRGKGGEGPGGGVLGKRGSGEQSVHKNEQKQKQNKGMSSVEYLALLDTG